MLNPFMILSKQSEVVLTHFRWKIHITNSLAILMMRFDDISDSLPSGPLRAQCSALKNAPHQRSPDIVDVGLTQQAAVRIHRKCEATGIGKQSRRIAQFLMQYLEQLESSAAYQCVPLG